MVPENRRNCRNGINRICEEAMSQDQYLFLEPDESLYVMTKCKDGYEVFRMYVDKGLGTCTAFVENFSEREAANLRSSGETLSNGYREKRIADQSALTEK